ncbi:hypothetical protein LTR66_009890 [Elasticomyces elasticus]|nr:hypothetical protein LTR66_009890 [Elasticomyces elasticus]
MFSAYDQYGIPYHRDATLSRGTVGTIYRYPDPRPGSPPRRGLHRAPAVRSTRNNYLAGFDEPPVRPRRSYDEDVPEILSRGRPLRSSSHASHTSSRSWHRGDEQGMFGLDRLAREARLRQPSYLESHGLEAGYNIPILRPSDSRSSRPLPRERLERLSAPFEEPRYSDRRPFAQYPPEYGLPPQVRGPRPSLEYASTIRSARSGGSGMDRLAREAEQLRLREESYGRSRPAYGSLFPRDYDPWGRR